MSKNHLIIGLGGTGGNILCEMRKRIYEEFRSNDAKGVYIDYLYVDSSPADLDDRTKWKTMGGSVHLLEAQKVSIHGVSAKVLNDLGKYPGIRSFISPEDRKLLDDLGSLITDGIGGQRRRLGRLLFSNNLNGEIAKSFATRLKSSVQRLTDTSTEHEVVFHVCAGLAGGTGSGSIIDTIAQIRKEYAPLPGSGNPYKLNLYLYVPEIIIATPRHNAGYYQANGYAALQELNAISIEGEYRYKPFDVTGRLKDEYGEVKRLLDGCDAFEAAYLFSNVNEAGRILKIGSELPAAVADFLFQKIVAANMTSRGQMARLSNAENAGTSPERDSDGTPVHSRKFISFGVKRVEYPESEIQEYVTYSFARQAARQMQFNVWRDGIGYDECTLDEVGLGIKTELAQRKTVEELLLSDNYLTLSKPIAEHEGTKRWREIKSGWEINTQKYHDEAIQDKEKKNWLGIFTKNCELYYNENYRGEGVEKFYKTQRGEIKAYAARIRRHVEEKLFNEWHSGAKSILEIEKYVTLLIDDCETRLSKFKEQIAEKENIREQKINPEIKKRITEWNNIGWILEALTGKPNTVFKNYKTAKCDFYTIQTEIAGFMYASELMQTVIIELGALLKNIVTFEALLTDTLKHVEEQIEAKCKPQTENEKGENKIVKKYDPAFVRETTKRFTIDSENQSNNARNIRNELVKLLGEEGKRSFNELYGKLDMSSLEDIFINTCIVNATKMMNDLAVADSSQKMIDVNILEKIKQEYNTDDRLEEFIRNLVRSAQCYLQFNDSEIGQQGGSDMMRMIQLCLPEYNDPTNFRQKFINKFRDIAPGFDVNEDLSVNYKVNQIVVIAAASAFPLRYVSNVATLKEKYREMLKGEQAALNKMVLHTESFVNELPELFYESMNPQKLIPVMLLAYGMDLLVEKQDPSTGATFKAIGFPDEFDVLSGWINLGKNIVQSVERLAVDESNVKKVKKLVDEKLKTEFLHNDKKRALKKAIGELLQSIQPLFPRGDMDRDYLIYKDAAKKLLQNEIAEK